MFIKKLLAGSLTAALVVTMIPGDITQVSAEDSGQAPKEITIDKNDEISLNPINGFDEDGNPRYGGDPSVLVDGDTVYLYVGRDSSQTEGYWMLDWACYSTKDLKNWTYEGIIMSADKESITWANTGTDAWAGQVAKYGDKYYFYYCTWDSTANDSQSAGKQSIGVAVSDSATGPFTDIGEPLVPGTLTTGETSGWNDIDPTVWIETDSEGVEHRYLCWGNGKVFICELNEDMVSVKDVNGDDGITFGKQTSSKLEVDADVIEMVAPTNFTEAPWLYRRTDENGNYYGDYYLFYAYAWREQMAYATISEDSSLMSGKWSYKKVLMPPTATSNTNHMAVFDFNGKTYFIYHNGSLPGGSGFRRSACIAEVHFNEDGSIEPIPETTIGIDGTTSAIYTSAGTVLTHDTFTNSSDDSLYPYKDIAVTAKDDADSMDAQWVISAGKADKTKDSYVSIQSENKPGLYLTVNDDKSVTLSQDYTYPVEESAAKSQTFKTVEGLADSNGVSFESVSQPGEYLTLIGSNSLCVTNGSLAAASTFYMNEAPDVTDEGTYSSANALKSLAFTGYTATVNGTNYSTLVPYDTTSVSVAITLEDEKGYYTVNDIAGLSGDSAVIPISSVLTNATLKIFAEDGTQTEAYTITINKDTPVISPVDMADSVVYTFGFEDATGGAFAVTKGFPPAALASPSYNYTTGVNGKAISLDGTYGLELGDANKLGDNYSISFWMNPDELHTGVDPIFTAGLFSPEHWLNMTFTRPFWSNNGGYIDDAGTVAYTANKWQHVALTVEGESAKLYIDGELTASGTIATGIMTNTGAKLYLGVNAWDAYFKGSVDEIAILNRAITDNEVKAIAYNEANIGNNFQTTTGNDNPDVLQPSTPKANTITAKNISKTAATKKQTVKIGASALGSAKLTYTSSSKKITVNSSGTVTIPKNYAGKATITIKSAATSAYKAATKKITVTVKPAAVKKAKIKATGKKKAVTVKYAKAAGAVKYKVEVSTSKKFTKKTTKSTTVKKLTATIKKLKAKKKYYVRVTAIGNNSVKSSAVVAKKTVKTKK